MMIYLLTMVIFHSYVSLPEGTYKHLETHLALPKQWPKLQFEHITSRPKRQWSSKSCQTKHIFALHQKLDDRFIGQYLWFIGDISRVNGC